MPEKHTDSAVWPEKHRTPGSHGALSGGSLGTRAAAICPIPSLAGTTFVLQSVKPWKQGSPGIVPQKHVQISKFPVSLFLIWKTSVLPSLIIIKLHAQLFLKFLLKISKCATYFDKGQHFSHHPACPYHGLIKYHFGEKGYLLLGKLVKQHDVQC